MTYVRENKSMPTPLGGITSTVVNGSEAVAARDSYYSNIQELTDSQAFKSLIGNVTLTAPPSSASEARDDFGAFLSLIYLTPFSLKPNDLTAASVLKNINATNADLALKWAEDSTLTPEQIANGEANFSDMYLNDRAAMLSWKLRLNAEDFIDNNGFGYMKNIGTKSYHFEDITTKLTIDINKTSNTKRSVIFGENIGPINADTLTGSDNADHLYGMAGADTLNGGKGNDWLESNYYYARQRCDQFIWLRWLRYYCRGGRRCRSKHSN